MLNTFCDIGIVWKLFLTSFACLITFRNIVPKLKPKLKLKKKSLEFNLPRSMQSQDLLRNSRFQTHPRCHGYSCFPLCLSLFVFSHISNDTQSCTQIGFLQRIFFHLFLIFTLATARPLSVLLSCLLLLLSFILSPDYLSRCFTSDRLHNSVGSSRDNPRGFRSVLPTGPPVLCSRGALISDTFRDKNWELMARGPFHIALLSPRRPSLRDSVSSHLVLYRLTCA